MTLGPGVRLARHDRGRRLASGPVHRLSRRHNRSQYGGGCRQHSDPGFAACWQSAVPVASSGTYENSGPVMLPSLQFCCGRGRLTKGEISSLRSHSLSGNAIKMPFLWHFRRIRYPKRPELGNPSHQDSGGN
jgi:hypothetical protein